MDKQIDYGNGMNMTDVPQKKGRAMKRMMTGFMVMLCVLAATLSATSAYAQQGRAYGEPPAQFSPRVQADDGNSRPYVYDMYTSMQVSYWGAVVDGLSEKFAYYAEDITSLDSPERMWDFIDEKNIRINEQEAKVMCIFMRPGDDPPADDVVPNWPSGGWPECGGVLDTMFGDGFAGYISGAGNNERSKRIYQYLFLSMGIDANQIEATIEQASGQGVDFEDEARNDAMECYTPADNIRRFDASNCGILCTVTRIVMGLLNSASAAIVEATAGNPNFTNAVVAALVLYIVIYGAMVVLGFVNIALGDAVVRVAKLGVVAMVVSSETVMQLFHVVRCFFIEGTTYLANAVMVAGVEAVGSLGVDQSRLVIEDFYNASAAGGSDLCGASFSDADSAQGPLVILEALVTQVFSSHMMLVVLTLMMSKVYGFILALFLIFGLFGFVMSLLGAVTIYLTSLIGQYLLLSLMPIFIVFLLFEKTKHLFDGWVNQLITYSLTPIFLFAYISLFVVVISAALAQLLDVRICWMKWFSIAWVFDLYKWHFVDWQSDNPMRELPFGFFEVLIFVLLVFLMKEFEDSVEQVARDIGNSYVYVNKAAREMQQWFHDKKGNVKAKAVQTMSVGAKKAMTGAGAAARGHRTQSGSGQRGVGGGGGARAGVRNMVSRKGPGKS